MISNNISIDLRALWRLVMMMVFSILSIGILTSQCLKSYPNAESFETDLGVWKQSTSDNFDWTRNMGTTPTSGTGPTSAMNGSYYLYADAAKGSNAFASIETCLDLEEFCAAEIEFNYHMLGINIKELVLEVSTDNGLSWTSIWSESGDQGASWYVGKIDLDGYANKTILLRFTASNNGPIGDIALDNIRLRAFRQARISDISYIDPKCELNNGSITIKFEDVPNVDSIQFSLDGATTWSNAIADNSVSVNFPNLGPGTYDLWVKNNTDDCEIDLDDEILKNQASPSVTFTMSELEYCNNEGNITLNGGLPAGGEYSGPGVSSGIFNLVTAGPGIHTITYTFTDANDCTSFATQDFTVYAAPAVTLTLTNDTDCEYNSSLVLGGGLPGGGTYTGTGVTGANFDASVAGTGTHTITYTYTDSNGCVNKATDDIIVYEKPAVALTLDKTKDCENSTSLTLSGGIPTGGTYSGSGVTGTNFDASIAGVGVHTITYTYTDGNGCENTAIDKIEVFAQPSVSLSLSTTTSCENENVQTLTEGLPSGGTYSGTGVTGNNFDASSAGVGVHTITYTFIDGNGCQNTASDDIEVFAQPTISLAFSDSDLCVSESSFALNEGSPSGGVYSGSGVTGSNFNASTAGVGVHTITYTFTDINGCQNTASDDLEVFGLPTVSLSLVNTKDCDNNSTLLLAGGTPSGGSYSGSGVTGTNFDASTAGVGVHTITYTYADGNGCESTSTDEIEVFAQPTVSLSLTTTTTCENETNQALTEGTPTGGTYSGAGVTGTNFDASAAGVGVHTITYTYLDDNNCENFATDDIEVFAQPNVTLDFSVTTVCHYETSYLLNEGSPAGGTFSGPGVSGSNFDASVAGLGMHTITYTYIDANGCSASATDDIVVVAKPVVTLSLGTTTTCDNESAFTLTGGVPAGGVYSGISVTGSTFDPSVAGDGVHTITYTYTDANGCENFAEEDIAVYSTTAATLGLASTTDCVTNNTFLLSGGTPSGGTFSGSGVTGTNFDASSAGVGIHVISYTFINANGCEDIATESIEVFANPSASLTLPTTEICVASTSSTLGGGAPTGGSYSGAGVSGTNFDASIAGIGTHTITYTYTDANGCSDTATDEIQVFDLPSVNLVLTTTTDCVSNSTLNISGGTPSGGSYSGAGVTGTNFDANIAGIGVHTITYTYTDANGCTNTADQDIEVFDLPSVSLALTDDSDCEGSMTLALGGGIPLGGTYSGTGVSGTNFDASVAGLGAHTITYTYTDGNGCINSAIDEITVHALTSVSLILSPDEICEDLSGVNLAGGLPAGGTYSGTGVSGNWFNANVAGVGNHTITYTYLDPAGCENTATDVMTVRALPTVGLALVDDHACEDEIVSIMGATPAGGTFSGTGVAGSDFDATIAGVGSHTITYTFTDVHGCTNVSSDGIAVTALPNVQLNLTDDNECETSTTLNLSGGIPTGGSYSGTTVSGSTFNPSVAGAGVHTITYTFTDDEGCVDFATDELTVYALPNVTLSLTQTTVCSDEAGFTLSGGMPAGGTYSGPGVGGNYFNVATAGIGVHTITYTYIDPVSGCEDIATQDVEVYAVPDAKLFLTDDEECNYNTSLSLAGGTPFGGVYSGPGVTGDNFDASAAGIGTHTITYTYTDANGCTDFATDRMVVHNETWVGLTFSDDTECTNNTTKALTEGLPVGGTYSGPGVSGTNFDGSVAGLGTHTITYTFIDANGCEYSASDDITVSDPPVVTLNLVRDDACEDYWGFNLEGGTPAGGSWSGTGVSGNYFDVAIAGTGTHPVTYSYTDPVTGCTNTATQNVYIYSLPVVALDFANDQACVSSSTFALTEGLPTGGVYSGPGVTGTNFDASVAGLGAHTITYTYTDVNGCENTSTDDIEVTPLPSTSLALANTTFCLDDDNETLSGGTPAGGTYSGPGVTGTTLDIGAAGVGTHTITYTYTDGSGCEDSSTQDITIHDLPTVGFTLSDDTACLFDITHALDGATPAGGVFSGPGVVGNQLFTLIAGVGTHTITYTVTDAIGCTNTATDEVTVANLPEPNLTLSDDEACEDEGVITLGGGSPAGGTWSGTGVSGNTFDPAVAGVGIHTITYSFTSGDCYEEATDEFTVHALPAPSISLAQTEVCIGDRFLLTSYGSPSGGIWSGPGVNNDRFRSAIAGVGTHTLSYSYTDVNGCTAIATTQVTVYDLPVVTLTLPVTEDCESNNTLALSGGSPVGGVYSGNGVTGTNFDASAAGEGTHQITYTYTDANGCKNIATAVITVYQVPEVKLELDDDSACIDDGPVTLLGGRPIAGTWSGPGVTGNQIDPAVAGIGVHTITYTFTVNGCSDSATDQFEVHALPTVILNLPDLDYCLGENITLSGGSPLGGTYSGTGVNFLGIFRTTVAGLGTHPITYTYKDANGCVAEVTQNVVVHDVPAAGLTLDVNEGCATDSAIPLSGGTPAGGTYSGPGVAGNFMDATDPSAGQGTHTITYTYLDANGCEAKAIDEMTIYSSPDVDFTVEDENCGKNDGSINLTFTNHFDILWIQFSLDGGANWQNAIRDNTGGYTYDFLTAGSYDIVVRNANGTCEHSVGTAVINNINGPTANAGVDVSIVPPGSTTLNGSGGSFYQWSPSNGLSNSSIANPIASPSVTTTYTLEVTDINGCKDSDQVTVTVVPPCAGTIVDGEYPYYENFESGLGLWSQEIISDDFDWTLHTGSTATSGTGPNSASRADWYLYTEADGHNNQTAIIKSPCFDLTGQSCAQFDFDYHMFGNDIDELRVEASVDFGQTWSVVWDESSDHGNSWNRGSVNLLGFVSAEPILQLRIVADLGNGNASDFAIDFVEFKTTGCGCSTVSSPFGAVQLLPDPQPFSVDIDCDGDADLLAGTDGDLFFLENNGNGTYTNHTGLPSDIMPTITHLDMTVGLADLDGDGDYDMSVVGNEPSNKRFYWNTGDKNNPEFTLAGSGGTPPSPIAGFDFNQVNGGAAIGYADASIFWVDLDRDNDYDAVVGGKLGWFLYYENIGDENNPNLVQRLGGANPFDGLRADGEDEGNPSNPCPGSQYCQYESSPVLVDWDGDGDFDMFTGNQVARVQFFENIGTPTNPIFVERVGVDVNPFHDVILDEDSHIAILDEDCDGDFDVYYGLGDTPATAAITSCDLQVATPNGAIAISDQTNYCNGQSIYLQEVGTVAVSWSWEGPNGFTSNLSNPSIPNATDINGGTYTVTITNSQGCESVDEVTLGITGATADAGIDVCIELGESVTLDGEGNGVTFMWSPTSGLSNPSILKPTATPVVTTTYILSVTDFNGCTATDEVTVQVKSDICEEEAEIFSADFENTTGDNFWTMNTAAADGDFEIAVPYPYYTAGNLMELTAHTGSQTLLTGNNRSQDLDGGVATARSRNIVISPSATNVDMTFYWYMSHAYNGNSADFLNIEIRDASNGTTLQTLVSETGAAVNKPASWTFHNANLAAHAGKTIYIWVEAADNPGGSKMEVAIDDISITEAFSTTADFSMSDVDYCENNPVITLTGATPPGGVFSGPGVSGNTFDPSVAGPGLHAIVYQFTTDSGCTATTSLDFEIFELPLVQIDLDVTEACETITSVALFGGLPTGGTYSGTAVTGDNFSPSSAGVGDHVITYTVTDANGCENSATDTFVVLAAPVVTSVSSENATCGLDNGSITIEFDDVAAITNIEFSLDGGVTWETPNVPDTDGSVTYSNLSVGTYDVWVREVSLGCEIDLDDATIIDEPGPQVNAGLDQTLCDGDSGMTSAVVVGGTTPITYSWSGPDSFTSSSADITMSSAGIFTVTVTDDNGCSATDVVVLKYLEVEPGQILEPTIACPENDPDLIEGLEPGFSCNLLDNHEFIDDISSDDWYMFTNAAATASYSQDLNSELSGVESGFVDVQTITGTDWHIMLVQNIGAIYANETYDFTFEAKATVPTTIQVQLQEAQAPYTSYGTQNFTIGTTANSFTWSGIAPNVDHNNIKIQFRLGGSDTDFWIDNTVLQPASCSNAIIEYSWECRESDGAGGWSAWTGISGATAEDYDPPVQNIEKQYRRLANVQGCADYEASNIVTVDICPCTLIAVGDATICPGQSASLTAAGTGLGTLTYVWSPATGLDNANISNPTATPTTTTTYTVTMTDESDCTLSEDVTVTVTPEVIADAGADEVICIGESAALEATGGVLYFWTPATGLSNQNIPNPNASPTVTTTYTVLVTDANGCTDTDEVIVTVNETIDNIIVTSEDASCGEDNGSITITWETNPGVTDIQFSLDGGVTFETAISASLETVTYTGLTVGSYDLWVERSDEYCSTDINDATIIDQPGPSINAGPNQEICEGDNVSVTPTVTNGTAPITFEWEGPASFTSTDPSVSITEDGIYTVIATDANNCKDTDYVVLYILDTEPGQIGLPTMMCPENDPGIITSTEPASACNIVRNHQFDSGTSAWTPYVHTSAGATMTIDNNSVLSGDNSLYVDITSPTGTRWHVMPYQVIGSVQASETYELSFEAVAETSKTIGVMLQEAQPPYAALASTNITIGTTPNVYNWSAIAPGIDHNNVRLQFMMGADDINMWLDNVVFEETDCVEPVIEYTWECRESNGTGGWLPWTTVPAATSSTYDPPAQTVTKQYRRLSNVLGCDNAALSNHVEVELCPCTADAGDDAAICFGETTQLNASGTGVGSLSYEWSPAASLDNATTAIPFASPESTTTYIVTVTDDNGCTATDDVLVTVSDTTEIFCERYRIRIGDNWPGWTSFNGGACVIETCEGAGLFDIQFDGGPEFPTGWVWTDEDGNVDNETDTRVVFGNIGLNDAGIYTGVYTNPDGCVSTLTFEVIVHPNIIADAGPDESYCEGAAAVTLTASGGSEFLWDDPAGSTTASISVNPSVTTTYSVTVTEGSCSDVDEVTVTVFTNPSADAGPDDQFCIGENTQLAASGGVTYVWSPAAGLSNSNIANPIASVTSTTTFTVTVTDINGCTDVDDVLITVDSIANMTVMADGALSCNNESVELTATPTGLNYQWTGPNGFNSTDASPEVTEAGQYTVTITDPLTSCERAESVDVILNASIVIDSIHMDCLNDAIEVHYTAEGVSTAGWIGIYATDAVYADDEYLVMVNITLPGTGIATFTDIGPTAHNLPEGDYEARIFNGTAYELCGTEDFFFTPRPTALPMPDEKICKGGYLDLTVSTNDAGTFTYEWNDPANTLAQTVTVSPDSETTYTVVITNQNGCSTTAQVLVEVEEPPMATLEGDRICAGESTTLEANLLPHSGFGTVEYQWQKSWAGDTWVDIPDETSPTYTTPPLYATTKYRVLTSWVGDHCEEHANPEAVVEVDLLSYISNVDGTPSPICPGGSAELTVNGDHLLNEQSTWIDTDPSQLGYNELGDANENNWYSALGPWGENTTAWEVQRKSGANPIDGGWETDRFDIDPTKTYRFSVWINRKFDGDGQFFFGAQAFGATNGVRDLSGTLTTTPYFEMSANPMGYLEDEWVMIVGHIHPHNYSGSRHPDSGIYSLCRGKIGDIDDDFKWLPGTTEAIHTLFQKDATDANGRMQFLYPRVEETNGNEPTIEGLFLGYESNGGLGEDAVYEWFEGSCGGAQIGTGQTITVNPLVTTTYYVRAVGKCNTTDCEPVTIVVQEPVATLNEPADACVNGDEMLFTATPAPGTVAGDMGVFTLIPGLTDNGDGTATLDPAVAGVGTHEVTYTYTDDIGCEAIATSSVTVLDIPNPDAGVDVEICDGEEIELIGTGGGTYSWSPAIGLSDPNIANPTASPSVTTTYTLTVTNADGCSDTDEVTVTVHESLDVSVVAISHDYCEDSSGEATVTISNGVGPFTIEWQTTAGTENGSATLSTIGDYTITDLNGGTTYCIQVTDSNGCTVITP